MRDLVIVGGAVANKLRSGGEAWVRLSWAAGLRRLGLDVLLVEQIAPAACTDADGRPTPFESCVQRAYFREVAERFGWADHSALVLADTGDRHESEGLPWDRLLDAAGSARLLVNISGHLALDALMRRLRRKAYVDIDPGFTQFWHADPSTPFRVGGHDVYLTIGENIGSPDCPIPTGGIDWRPTRQPVVLDDWPVSREGSPGRFTTVASWRGPFGAVEFGGRRFGLKCHEFRKYLALPAASPAGVEFEVALNIHDGDRADREALERHGWHLVDPVAAAGDPGAFRRYVQQSGAEFSVAQGIYVDTRSGWFSDRTVRYLASGKPALVQETGFGRNLKTGDGLVPFTTPAEAAEGVRRITTDYAAHAQAARAVAEAHFDSDKVLPRLLGEAGVG